MVRNKNVIFSIALFSLIGAAFQPISPVTCSINNKTPFSINVRTQYVGKFFGKKFCKDRHVTVSPHSSAHIKVHCFLKQADFTIMKNQKTIALMRDPYTSMYDIAYTISGPIKQNNENYLQLNISSYERQGHDRVKVLP